MLGNHYGNKSYISLVCSIIGYNMVTAVLVFLICYFQTIVTINGKANDFDNYHILTWKSNNVFTAEMHGTPKNDTEQLSWALSKLLLPLTMCKFVNCQKF